MYQEFCDRLQLKDPVRVAVSPRKLTVCGRSKQKLDDYSRCTWLPTQNVNKHPKDAFSADTKDKKLAR